jgi:hypothetical protein
MNEEQIARPRTRSIDFAEALSQSEIEALQSSLLDLEGTNRVEISESQALVEYVFPQSNFSDIWACLQELGVLVRLAMFERIRNTLAAFREENERDHYLQSRHWHIHIRNIYVHYAGYRELRSADAGKNLWRRYQSKS